MVVNKIILSALGLFFVSGFFIYSTSSNSKISKRQVASIEAIMNDSLNPEIIKRCKKDHNYTDEDMIMLEREFKRYIALSAAGSENMSGFGMYSKDVDNVWHTFILFTKDYAAFCEKHFGRFIHHVPEIITETPSQEYLAEAREDFRSFICTYEKTFSEEIHPIWLLDSYEMFSSES